MRQSGAGAGNARRGEFDPHRLAPPEFFEVVVGPDRRLHDVDDDVAEVDQHPLAGVFAFDRNHMAAMVPDLVPNACRKRSALPVGGGADDDDPVKEPSEFRGVEDLDVMRFDILECVDDQALRFGEIPCQFRGDRR